MLGIERGCEWYDKLYEEDERNKYSPKGGLYVKAYSLISKGNILDIGCGSGRLVKVLQDNNYSGQYLGVDFSKNAIDYCKKTYPFYSFRVSDVFDISMERFDTIISLELFEHINDDIELIKKIPKNKTLIFSVPSFGGPSHVRYFEDITEIKKRYNCLLNFEEDIIIDRIFLFKTVRL